MISTLGTQKDGRRWGSFLFKVNPTSFSVKWKRLLEILTWIPELHVRSNRSLPRRAWRGQRGLTPPWTSQSRLFQSFAQSRYMLWLLYSITHNDQVQVDLPWWWGGRAISPPKKICFNAALVFDLFIFCIFLVPHLPGVGDEGRLLSDPSLHLGWWPLVVWLILLYWYRVEYNKTKSIKPKVPNRT